MRGNKRHIAPNQVSPGAAEERVAPVKRRIAILKLEHFHNTVHPRTRQRNARANQDVA
jgi:hypothetical protein